MDENVKKTLKRKNAFLAEIRKEFPEHQARDIWSDAARKLQSLYREYPELSKGVRMHTDNFIFPAAAIYLAIKEKDEKKAYPIMQKVMAEGSTKTGKQIARALHIPGAKKLFVKMWDVMSHKMFGETAGFQNIFYPAKKNEFRMDITQCPYSTYLTKAGCPEITILFCENDIHAYGNLPGLNFIRTKTIGGGAELCDFYMKMS